MTVSELHPTTPTPPPAPRRPPSHALTDPPAERAREPRLSWFARRRREALDRAASTMHDRLEAQVMRGERPRATTGTGTALLVLSVVVLGVFAAAVVLLVVLTFAPKNVWGWLGVALAWVVVVAVAPRPGRVEARELPPDEFPLTHAFVGEVAAAVGTSTPHGLGVTTEFTAFVAQPGLRRRPVLVIGLPVWTMLTDDERVALLAHELGHLRGSDTALAHLVDLAHGILLRLATLLTPLPGDSYSDFADYRLGVGESQATMNAAGAGILRAVSAPATGLLLLFERLAAVDGQRREYLADLRAAEIAGTAANVRLLLTMENLPGLHTLAGAAVRRREDPFAALEQVRERPAPTGQQVAAARARAREQDLRWDASHPRDDLRLALVEAVAAKRSLPRTAAEAGSDRELAGLRHEMARELGHQLTDTYY
jgi:Zn-dependent protease with chaperone function